MSKSKGEFPVFGFVEHDIGFSNLSITFVLNLELTDASKEKGWYHSSIWHRVDMSEAISRIEIR